VLLHYRDLKIKTFTVICKIMWKLKQWRRNCCICQILFDYLVKNDIFTKYY